VSASSSGSRHRPPQRRSGRPRRRPRPSTTSCRSSRFPDTIDPIVADYIERSITAAENDGALYLVMQFNSGGSVLTRQRFGQLAARMRDAKVPIAIWVGPSGAKAKGGAAQLCVGRHGRHRAEVAGRALSGRTSSTSPRSRHRLTDETVARLRNDTIGSDDSALIGASSAPTIGQFLIELPGFRTEIDTSGDQPTIKPLTPVVFSALPLLSEPVAHRGQPAGRLFVVPDWPRTAHLRVLHGGCRHRGVVGAGSFVLGCYGLDVLPARWWAVALLVFAMFGFAVDVQTGVPCLDLASAIHRVPLLGSFFLYDGVDDVVRVHRRHGACSSEWCRACRPWCVPALDADHRRDG